MALLNDKNGILLLLHVSRCDMNQNKNKKKNLSIGHINFLQRLFRSFKEFIFILQMYCQLLLTGRVALFADSGEEKKCVLDAS